MSNRSAADRFDLTDKEREAVDAQSNLEGPWPTPKASRLGLRFAVTVAVSAGVDREALLDAVAADYDEIKRRGSP